MSEAYDLQVTYMQGKGRGVIAGEDIPRGQKLSVCPVIIMPRGALDGTPLENHCWRDDEADCLALGIQTLCNHSDDPNCVSIVHNQLDFLISIKPIKAYEELTLCYFDFGSSP